jgi:hypothetical protein
MARDENILNQMYYTFCFLQNCHYLSDISSLAQETCHELGLIKKKKETNNNNKFLNVLDNGC